MVVWLFDYCVGWGVVSALVGCDVVLLKRSFGICRLCLFSVVVFVWYLVVVVCCGWCGLYLF